MGTIEHEEPKHSGVGVFPMPSWPRLLLPQHHTPPLVDTTQVCPFPAAIAMTETPVELVRIQSHLSSESPLTRQMPLQFSRSFLFLSLTLSLPWRECVVYAALYAFARLLPLAFHFHWPSLRFQNSCHS